MTDRYAVIGHPIGHSKSPRIHAEFARQTGQDLHYEAIESPLDDFTGTVQRFFAGGGCGLNVTVPFKEQAWQMADWRTDRASLAGAANTLYRESGELVADNTDGAGLVRDLTHNHALHLAGRRLLVLGAGGAVRGVLGPLLAQQPAELVIANRTLAKAEALAGLMAPEAGACRLSACAFDALQSPFDLIINGTSASLSGQLPPLPEALVSADTVAYDMMYSAASTPFCQWAEHQGAARALDGLGMLVEQAAEAFRVWRGVLPETRPVLAQMRE